MKRAESEGKPLFVAFLMDNEPANDQTVKEHYTDPQIVKLLGNFVCLIACIGEHKGDEAGCAKFRGIQCAHHQAIEKKARDRWLVGDLVCTPQHVFCDAKGNVLRRKVYLISKATLAKCLLMTLDDCGIDTKGLQVDFGKDSEGGLVDSERASVTSWLEDLDSRNLEVRETALRGLGSAEDPRAMPAVLKMCAAKNDDATRLAAIGALGRKGNYLAVEPLTALLGDKSAPILVRVAGALETIEMPVAVPALLAAIKKEKRDRVLGPLLRAAAGSQPGNADTRDVCLKNLKSASARLTAHVLVALGHLDTHDKIVAAMVPQLASKNQNTRGLAVWVLGSQRTSASTKALQQLQEDEKTPEVQKVLGPAVRRSRGETVEGYASMYWTFFTDYAY
ncbi:MAG: HEAT repeat domain-containing protein [Planctomycetota bacterium]